MITYMSIDGLHPIEIGHVSDNLTHRVEIDCSTWKRKYPALTRFEICVTRPDGMIYCPKTEVNSAGKLVWVITDAETAIPGEGSYQVIGTGRYGDRRASRPAGLSIEANMPGIDSERAPDPSKPWVKKVFDAAAAAEQFAKDAAVSAETMLHPPIIGENGNWWLWDVNIGDYADSGSDSRGHTLPTASAETKGGVKVGSGLKMDGEVLNAEVTKQAFDALSGEIAKLKDNGGAGIEVDETLTESGKAADAAVTGQRITEIDNAIFDIIPGKNLVDPSKLEVGLLRNSGELATTSNAHLTYGTSGFIAVDANTNYTLATVLHNGRVMSTAKMALLYDSEKNTISGGYTEASTEAVTFNAGGASYVRVCGQIKAAADGDVVANLHLEKGDAYTGFEPYTEQNKVLKVVSPGILYGKKYVVCGDSFTAGDFTGYVDENGLSGKNSPVLYDSDWKMYKTYPWWIAKRNSMTLVNDSECGTTMALDKTYVADPENVDINTRNPFSNERYKRIPSDADYITVWFGLNDANNTNLGTIDDTDNTTFYGAWNVVLEYLLVNHPYAKVGIVVTDGITNHQYQDAVREVAKKWGFPYLDLVADPQIPAMISGRDAEMGLCARAKELRDAAFRVSSNNFHPSIKAHEYRSTIIENWLRTL